MTISGYLAHTGKTVAQLAEITGIPRTTIYRWKDEEDRKGYVVGIDAESLRRLNVGTDGAITPDDVVGAKAG